MWLGHDELLGRRVAVKTLHPALAADDALRARFRHEAVAAARLSHPNVVATYDTGDDHGTAFIVMELVEGESLRELLDRRGALEPAEAASIAHQVALALDHAHRHGIVHRDIKPANVLVPRDGPVKVTDFGIAKAAGGADHTRTGMVVGTARYLSPEQVQGLPADPRTDVYALGLVLYEMLAGRPAFQGDTEMATALARLSGPPRPIAEVRPGIPAPLAALLDQTLQPDPAHRIPSAADFDRALTRAMAGVAPRRPSPRAPAGSGHSPPRAAPRPVARPGAPSGKRRPSRLRRVVGVLAFLVFLAALGTAAALVTTWIVEDGPAGGSGEAPSLQAVRDFDPLGDGTEHPETAAFAADGNPATAWRSEEYASRDFGGAKPGVGLVLELAADTDVSAVAIEGAPGADVEVYVAGSTGSTLAQWGPRRAAARDLAADAVVSIRPAARGRFVLLWFTLLPRPGTLEVREVRVA